MSNWGIRLDPEESFSWLRNYFYQYFVELTILHLLNILDLLGSQKWRAGGQSYRFYFDVSELFQLVSYVQLRDTAGSGGVILGATKLFLPVFCRADHSSPFEHPRFAWISKMVSWRSVLQVLFRRIRAISASELCPIEGYGWIWRSHFRGYEIIFTSILSSWPFFTFWTSSICLDLKNGELEVSLTGSIPTYHSYFS